MKVSQKFCIVHATDNQVYSIGKSDCGALGIPGLRNTKQKGCLVNLPYDVKDIQVGDTHVLALLESGDVYAWGSNEYG